MSWSTDGSGELDSAVRDVQKRSDEEIARKLQEWALSGVDIKWGDFVARKYLEEAARRLRGRRVDGNQRQTDTTE